MSAFNKIYNKYITEAEKLQKLDNFSQVLNDNNDLKVAMELCLEIEALEQGAEAIVVGGSVRDILLGKKPKDIDIATNVDIDKIVSNFHTADIGKSKDFARFFTCILCNRCRIFPQCPLPYYRNYGKPRSSNNVY